MSSTGSAFSVDTLDPNQIGPHSITLRATVVNPDLSVVINSEFEFTVEILPPDCATSVLTCPTIQLSHGIYDPA